MAVTDFGKKYAESFQERKKNGELKRKESHEATVVDDALRQRVAEAVRSGAAVRAVIDRTREKQAVKSAARELAIDSVVRSAHEEAMRRLQQGMGEFQRTDFEQRATPAARTSVMTTRQAQNALNKRGIGLQKSWEQKALELAEQAVEERRQFFGDFSRPEEYAEYLKGKAAESEAAAKKAQEESRKNAAARNMGFVTPAGGIDVGGKQMTDAEITAEIERLRENRPARFATPEDENAYIARVQALDDARQRGRSAYYEGLEVQASKDAQDAAEYARKAYREIPYYSDFYANQQNPYERMSEEQRVNEQLDGSYSQREELQDAMTDEELAVMTYLRNTQGADEAQVFYKSIEPELYQRIAEGKTKRLVEYGEEHPVLGSAISTWMNAGNAVRGGAYILQNNINKALGQEEEIDPYDRAFEMGMGRDAIRTGVAQDMSPVGQFLYQTGMNIADSTTGALMLGGTGGAAMLATGAMTDTVRRVKEDGGEDWQAMTLGVIAGGAELLTEKMGFDRLGEIVGGSRGNIFRAVLGHMVSEFGEEAGTEIANIVADGLVMWDASEFAAIQAKDGTKAAITEMLKRVGMSGLGGALSGGVMGGGAAGINTAFDAMAQREIIKQIQRQQATDVLSGGVRGSGIEADQTIARLAEETVAVQEAERAAEAAQARTNAEVPARAVQAATVSAASAAPVQARANVPAEISRAAEKYGEDAGVFESNYQGGDAETYRRGFDAMYTAGRVGLKTEQISESTNMLTQGMDEATKKAIWTAGRNSMMRTVTPGVKRMDTKKATNAQKRQYAMLDAVGKRYGIEFMIVDSIEAGRANGAYSGGRRIVVAADAVDGAIVQAGAHELVHYLKRTDADGYSVLKEVVVGHLTKEDGMFDLDSAVRERIEEYAGSGRRLTEEDAIEEIVAEAVPTIFANEESVKAFVGKDRTLAEKVRGFIVKFVKEIREIAEKYMRDQGREEIANLINKADALKEIAETFDRALEAAGEKEAARESGEAVFARKRSKDADDVSKWTQDSRFLSEHLSAREREIFRRRVAAVSQGAKAEMSANGEYILECGHSLVYTDANPIDPKVFKVITFDTENGTMLDYAMQLVYDLEAEKTDEQELGIVLQSVLGEEYVAIRPNDVRATVRGNNGKREGRTGIATGEGNRGEVSAEDERALTNTGISVSGDGEVAYPESQEVRYSLRTLPETDYIKERDKAAAALAKRMEIDVKDAQRYIDNLTGVAAMIAADRARLDYEHESAYSAVKPNSDYKWTVDFSTLCKKRLLYTGTFDAIQSKLHDTVLTEDDYIRLRDMMAKKGYEVACAFCYVESRRKNNGEIIGKFLDIYREAEKNDGVMELGPSNRRKTFRIEKGFSPEIADFNTSDGIANILHNHKGVYAAYMYFMNARGVSKPKLIESRTDYTNEILSKFKSASAVRAMNRRGGLRLQSFSDFEVINLLDMMQVVTDMARVGLMSQAYTKVPEFARVFGGTGVKINLSLVTNGVDENNQLIFDDVEGMPHEEAFRIREMYSENVGTILVGRDDATIRAAMKDPRIDFIIPYHASGWSTGNQAALGIAGYTNYTMGQNETDAATGKGTKNFYPAEYWDFSKSGDENAEIYLQKCTESGKTPKFPQFAGESGYWKMLIDFKMYDNNGKGVPQRAVRPDVNMAEAKKVLDEYKGGHVKLPVAQDIVEEFLNDHKKRHEEAETSFSLNKRSAYGPNQPYDWAGDDTYTSFKTAEEARSAAEEMRMDVETEAFMEWFAGSKVVDEQGEPKIMYHGTSGSGFTQFDTYGSRYGLMGTGSYFTDNPDIAESYTKKGKGKTPGIYPVYLSIQNPIDMDRKITAAEAKAWRKYFGDYVLDGEIRAGMTNDEALRAVERGFEQEGMLKDEAGDYVVEFFESRGYDGITHIGGVVSGGTKHRVYIAFEPTQVKSATGNFGDFSAEDADIRFSLNGTSKAESVFTEEGKAMAPDVQLRSKTVAAYASKALKTGLTVKMEQQITGVANKILKEAGSSYDKSTMIENLKKVIGEYAETGATEDTLRALTEMSKAIIEQSGRWDDTLRNQYADLRKKLRETPISLTETQKQEAANEAGSYGEWRKGLFGAVNLTNDGISLDSLWGELSSQYPDMFPPETGEAEMVGKIKDFALMMRPRYENPYGMDMDGAALEMAMRLQGDMMVVAGAKDEAKAMYGTAKKLREQALNEYREKLKEQKQKRVADFQKIAADLKKAKAAGDSKAQAAVMNRYRAALKRTALDEAFAEVRATYKEREAQKAENRMRAELRGKVEKRAAELMEMLAGRKKGKRVPTALQGVVMDVLEALDINGRNAASVGEETVKSQAFRAKLGALREFYERVWNSQSKGESPDGLDGLMMTISERNIAEIQDALSALGAGNKYLLREMDSQQLKNLNELLKTVKHTVDSVGKLWKMKRYASVAQMGDAAISEMDDRGTRRFTEDTIAGKGRDFLALDMMEPVSYGERLGEAGKEIIQGLMDGEKVKFGMVRSAAEATGKMLKDVKATGYDIGKWRKTIREVKLGDGRTVRMSETQLMSMYLTAKRPQGMKHLLGEGMKFPDSKKTGVQARIRLTQADITKMAGMISDQQRALADRMGRYLSGELAKAGNNVTQRLYLYDAFTEENYWPITSDPNELKTQEPEGERAFNAIVNAGFTKPVNQKASNPVIIMDAFDVFNRHVGEMASYVGYAEVMTDALAWLNYRQRDENGLTGRSVKDSMDKLLGKGGIEYLTKLIQDINGARRGGDGLHMGKLLGNYKKAVVMGKIRVAIQQPTSIVRAAAEIHPAYLIRGLKAGKGAIQEMQKWSSLAWWKANGNYDIGVGKGTDEILWGKTAVKDAVMEKISTQGGLVDPGKMDDWAWARMWSAVKREVKRTRPELKEGSDEYFRAVAERFEYICDRTQVVDTVMHRSDIMRAKDGLTKNLTAFRSEPIKSYNMLMRAIMEAGRNPKDRKAYAKVARVTTVFVTSSAANAAAKALLDAFKNRDDDDELWEYLKGGEFGRDLAEAFLKGFVDNVNLAYSIPYIGEALEAVQGEDVTMMQFDSLSGIANAATTFYDHFFGENKKKTTVWGAMKPGLTTISQLAGLPVNGLMANAEILLRMYDPKLLQVKDDMQTTKAAYGKLYEATVGGDKKTALSVRTELAKGLHGSTPKNPREIDTGVAKILAARDERILKAWQMREQGNQARELAALHKEIQKGGFTDEQTKYAVNNVESIMNSEYESLIEEGKKQEAEALRAKMAKYGMEPEEAKEKDMTEELEAKTYQYKHLFAGIRNGDTDDVAVIAEVMEAESDAEDPAKSIRSEVSGEFREEYIALVKAGKTREAEALAKKLAIVGIDGEDVEEWVKDDSYADMKEYVAAGNTAEAMRIIDSLIESGTATVDGVSSSLSSRFRQEYIDLVVAGRDAEAEKLAERLQSLGLVTPKKKENKFRKEILDGWVEDWLKAQEK